MDIDPSTQRTIADVTAGGVILATWAAWLPAGAAGLAIVWYIIQIYAWIEKRFADRLMKQKRRPVRKRRSRRKQ